MVPHAACSDLVGDTHAVLAVPVLAVLVLAEARFPRAIPPRARPPPPAGSLVRVHVAEGALDVGRCIFHMHQKVHMEYAQPARPRLARTLR